MNTLDKIEMERCNKALAEGYKINQMTEIKRRAYYAEQRIIRNANRGVTKS